KSILLSLVRPDNTFHLGRFPILAVLQYFNFGLTGLELPAGNYLLRTEVLEKERLLGSTEEPLYVSAPFLGKEP
ncbi:MAG: hypothetical protein Q8N81_01755, partial [bacterium]|nr:hypothetical protein [bacterium]